MMSDKHVSVLAVSVLAVSVLAVSVLAVSVILESRLHLGQCVAQQANLVADVQRDVVALGLDPVDLVGAHQQVAMRGRANH